MNQRLKGLSQRQIEVLRLVCAGLAVKQVADTLGISRKTVEKHVIACHARLGAHERLELLRAAVQKGYVDIDWWLALPVSKPWYDSSQHYKDMNLSKNELRY